MHKDTTIYVCSFPLSEIIDFVSSFPLSEMIDFFIYKNMYVSQNELCLLLPACGCAKVRLEVRVGIFGEVGHLSERGRHVQRVVPASKQINFDDQKAMGKIPSIPTEKMTETDA